MYCQKKEELPEKLIREFKLDKLRDIWELTRDIRFVDRKRWCTHVYHHTLNIITKCNKNINEWGHHLLDEESINILIDFKNPFLLDDYSYIIDLSKLYNHLNGQYTYFRRILEYDTKRVYRVSISLVCEAAVIAFREMEKISRLIYTKLLDLLTKTEKYRRERYDIEKEEEIEGNIREILDECKDSPV